MKLGIGQAAWRGPRAEQVGRRDEVKVAASENRTQSESVRARGKRRKRLIFNTKERGSNRTSGLCFLCNQSQRPLEG